MLGWRVSVTAKKKSSSKIAVPKKGDKIIILGGDNYRIGMGGAAVSSADTGAFGSAIRTQCRTALQSRNAKTSCQCHSDALVESTITNPIVSIHDHGAGRASELPLGIS